MPLPSPFTSKGRPKHERQDAALRAEIAEIRSVLVSLKKSHDWLTQLNEEAARDEADDDAINMAQCDFDASLDMAKKLADPTWTEGYLERVAAWNRRYVELSNVVGKLPHTADGVPVVPGMKLYPKHPLPDVGDDHGIATIGIYDPATMEHHVHGYDEFRTGVCYSTREAAEAARGHDGD